MDYKEKYEQAIKRAKAMTEVANNQEETYNSVITIFPELKESKSFLNTLDVKKVDLDYIKKELDELIKPNGDFGWGTLYDVATHFFELGLKAKKE